MNDPRRLAVETLQNILENKRFFNEIKKEEAFAAQKEQAFLNMLILTALRRLVFLQKVISAFAAKKLPDKHAFARHALILAAAELLFLETPDYAVLNSYVNLVKKQNDKYVAGFVNAVLRKIAAAKEELLNADNGIFFPESFRKLLQKDYTAEQISRIETAAANETPLDLTVKTNPEFWAEKLGGTLLPNGTVRLENTGKIEKLTGYKDGSWWVQDFSASLAAMALSKPQNKNILDLCAAPGGKTAQLLAAGAQVTSLDISEDRLKTLSENIHRLQLPTPRILCADALAYLEDATETYDAVLLDAPCSATGTLRRHPEIVHIKQAADIQKMAALQKQILEKISKAIKTGGELIYCTCSIAKSEGEHQIKAFLQQHAEFRIIPLSAENFSAFSGQLPDDMFTPEGFVRTLPYHLSAQGGADSFFITKLQKVK